MRILFANQFFPPDAAPTGILIHELAEHLASRGHEVQFIHAGTDYRTGIKGSGRLQRELTALGRILWSGIQARKPDVVFSCSSPPCLLLVAGVLARYHGARSVHWAMDLYPELAVALKEIDPRTGERVGRWMARAYRATSMVVALDEDMRSTLAAYGINAGAIRPWVPRALQGPSDGERDPRFIWLYSGNLGRAHEWQTFLDVQAELERRGLPAVLRVQGGGAAWNTAVDYAAALGLERCEWNGYVPKAELRQSLLRASLLIVTQRPETRGMLWPSKLATVMELNRPVLFIGPSGAIGQALRERAGTGVFEPGRVQQIADWIEDRIAAGPLGPAPAESASYRDLALERWTALIEGLRRAD